MGPGFLEVAMKPRIKGVLYIIQKLTVFDVRYRTYEFCFIAFSNGFLEEVSAHRMHHGNPELVSEIRDTEVV